MEELAKNVLIQAGVVQGNEKEGNGNNQSIKGDKQTQNTNSYYFQLLEHILIDDNDCFGKKKKTNVSNIKVTNNSWTFDNNDDANNYDEFDMLLEEYGPFLDTQKHAPFYKAMSQLLCQAITMKSTTSTLIKSNHANTMNGDGPRDRNMNEKVKHHDPCEDFRNRNDLRAIRILSALLDLPSHLVNPMLLIHPPSVSIREPKVHTQSQVSNQPNNQNQSSSLIVSIMKYVAFLPDLEMHVRSIQRSLYSASMTSSSLTRSYNETSEGITSNPVNRQEQMQQKLQISTQLENELSNHVQSLEFILGTIYSLVGSNDRSNIKTFLGSILYSFPLTRLTRRVPQGLGVENTTACGIDMLLWIVYRIILGSPSTIQNGYNSHHSITQQNIQEDSSQSERCAVNRTIQNEYDPRSNNVYVNLIQKILLPLHTPHEMVLWRDQAPLLSLYHEPLVLCIVELCRQKRINPILQQFFSQSQLTKQMFQKNDKQVNDNQNYNNQSLQGTENTSEHDLHEYNRSILLLANVDWVIQRILDPSIWPWEPENNKASQGKNFCATSSSPHRANSAKVILILHEINTILETLLAPFTSKTYQTILHNNNKDKSYQRNKKISIQFLGPLISRLCTCIQGDNSRSAERALEFFKSNTFELLLRQPCHLKLFMKPLMKALCRLDRNMELAWNPTVNKMTKLVLMKLEEWDKGLFQSTANQIFCTLVNDEEQRGQFEHEEVNQSLSHIVTPSSGLILAKTVQSHDEVTSYSMTSLKSTMGKWRPPSRDTKYTSNTSVSKPPLTVTGVAPWALSSSPSIKNSKCPKSKSKYSSLMMPPPTNKPNLKNLYTSSPALPKSNNRPNKKQSLSSLTNELSSETVQRGLKTDDVNTTSINNSMKINDHGLRILRNYMSKLAPESSISSDDSDNVGSAWAKTQIMESPVLMPELKFHDLVFRHDELGKGAFSTVKYSRLILKDKPRSQWPEYAVKIVSSKKIEELGYSSSINREISILSIMSHPNIARLVSSFRFRDGAYLVLEYASKGDLHTILKRDGSLDHASAKFVIGEIVAALHSIHTLGFVYGDLKPENVLITETGHIKLTDFGGCRPVQESAKERLKNMKNLWKQMRDGDWRQKEVLESQNDVVMEEQDPCQEVTLDEDEDERIEGTTAYLPPEVALGSIPTIAADAWALGCVLFQCLSGRPPILEDTETETMQKIVTFDLDKKRASSFFGEDDSVAGSKRSVFLPETKSIITKLLSRTPSDRPSMEDVAVDKFFASIRNVFTLYKHPAPPLMVGKISPSPNAKWARRQLSTIWAPQPKSYGTGDSGEMNKSSDGLRQRDKTALRKIPIEEGIESKTYFASKDRSKAKTKLPRVKENPL